MHTTELHPATTHISYKGTTLRENAQNFLLLMCGAFIHSARCVKILKRYDQQHVPYHRGDSPVNLADFPVSL